MKYLSRISSLPATVLVVLAALVAGAAAYAVLQVEDEIPSASGSVGLTSASVWPSYQSNLDSFANIVRRDDVIEQVENSIGGNIDSVRTDGVEGSFVLDVHVTAESEEVAVSAVEEFIAIGIATQTDLVEGARSDELSALLAEQSALESTLEAQVGAEEAARREAIQLAAATDDGEFSFESEALYRQADANAGRATQSRNATEQQLRNVSNQVRELELQAELPSDQLYVVRDAELEDQAAVIDGPIPIVLAALSAAAAVASMLIARDRLNGPVRTAEQVERVLGLPVVAQIQGSDDRYEGVRLRQTLDSLGQTGTLEIVLDDKVELPVDDLHDMLSKAASSDDWISTNGSRGDAAVLAVRAGASSVDSIRRQMQLFGVGEVPLAGVILT